MWQIKASSLSPWLSAEIFTTRSPGKARVHLLVHQGGQCLDTAFQWVLQESCFSPPSCCSQGQGFPKQVLQPCPASLVQALWQWAGNSVPCPGSIPVCLPVHLGENHGTRPSLTGMHCCPSEEAHIQCPCHGTMMLFKGERNKCSQSLAGSRQLPPAWGCVPAQTSGMGQCWLGDRCSEGVLKI